MGTEASWTDSAHAKPRSREEKEGEETGLQDWQDGEADQDEGERAAWRANAVNANLQTIDGPIGREYDRTVSTGAATIPSCRKSRLRGALYIAAGSLLGYSAGVANFHAETWIDFSGRGVETRYSLFPFQMTATQSDRAFDLLLTPRVSRDPDWRRVGSDRFVSILGTCVLTEGYELLRAENRLVEVLTMKDFSRSQRREMERGFSLALQSGGAGAASDFATRTWEEAALTASDAEAPR